VIAPAFTYVAAHQAIMTSGMAGASGDLVCVSSAQ
jgi:hypothetical protein